MDKTMSLHPIINHVYDKPQKSQRSNLSHGHTKINPRQQLNSNYLDNGTHYFQNTREFLTPHSKYHPSTALKFHSFPRKHDHTNIETTQHNTTQYIPQEEMNAELDGEGVIIHPNDLMERELPELLVGPIGGEPSLEDAAVEEVSDPLHGLLALLLHGVVVVGGHEHPPAELAGVEEGALSDEAEEPVAVVEVVGVEEGAHVGGVEGEGVGGGELGRGVVEAVGGGEEGGKGRRVAGEEVVGEDVGST